MENGPFEDVFPVETGDIPASYVSLPEGRNSFVSNMSWLLQFLFWKLRVGQLCTNFCDSKILQAPSKYRLLNTDTFVMFSLGLVGF